MNDWVPNTFAEKYVIDSLACSKLTVFHSSLSGGHCTLTQSATYDGTAKCGITKRRKMSICSYALGWAKSRTELSKPGISLLFFPFFFFFISSSRLFRSWSQHPWNGSRNG